VYTTASHISNVIQVDFTPKLPKPSWATAAIAAVQVDEFGDQERIFILAWSESTSSTFSELLQAATLFPATQHMNTGQGIPDLRYCCVCDETYLADPAYTSWQIKKLLIDEHHAAIALALECGDRLPEIDNRLPIPPVPLPAPQALPELDVLLFEQLVNHLCPILQYDYNDVPKGLDPNIVYLATNGQMLTLSATNGAQVGQTYLPFTGTLTQALDIIAKCDLVDLNTSIDCNLQHYFIQPATLCDVPTRETYEYVESYVKAFWNDLYADGKEPEDVSCIPISISISNTSIQFGDYQMSVPQQQQLSLVAEQPQGKIVVDATRLRDTLWQSHVYKQPYIKVGIINSALHLLTPQLWQAIAALSNQTN
jgi:hypothetical protein